MSKIRAVFLAGAVVVGLGAIAGLAAFAPSLVGQKSATDQMTIQIPGGGTETLVYAGNIAPKVTFHYRQFPMSRPAFPAFGWTMPSFVALDPFIADLHRHLDMWARTPLVMRPAPDQLLNAGTFTGLPYGTSYWVVSETNGNGFCARFTQVIQSPDYAKPKVLSQTSGDCGTNKPANPQLSQSVKPVNLPRLITPAITQSM